VIAGCTGMRCVPLGFKAFKLFWVASFFAAAAGEL
jgi:hypothetical protein